jgi:catalase
LAFSGTRRYLTVLADTASSRSGLTDDEAKAKPGDFYSDELKERLAKGPASFDLVAIIGESGDPTDDPTAMWPEDARKTVKLGVIAITATEADASCDASTFDPANLADGIAGPTNDLIFAVRSPAYAVSLSRRSN